MPNHPLSRSDVIDLADLAILLDVDGTILDLAPTPQSVWVPPDLAEALVRLWQSTGGALAFVSGRQLNDLDRIFSPLQLPAIGGHGAEMRVAAGKTPQQPRIAPLDSELKRKFASIAEIAPGIVIEDKGYSLALHYRLAPEKGAVVRKSAELIYANLPGNGIELLPGKSMIEIKQVGFDKASAVRELMTYAPFSGRRPVFIGDDVTDQSVFAAMPEFGGIAISVGERLPTVDYCFERPADVRRWLEKLSQTSTFTLS
jgi:trehalose 6-phosphate phosphatase